jgi:Domain of unknown function DUF29
MAQASTSTQTSLYDQDFSLWLEATVSHLKARDFDRIDLENLIEEIEALGRSEKRELRNRLEVLLAHILKRVYIDSAYDNRGWQLTILTQRQDLRKILEDSPSLKSYFISIFDRAFTDALEIVREEYRGVSFPDRWQFSHEIEAILNEAFWDNDKVK